MHGAHVQAQQNEDDDRREDVPEPQSRFAHDASYLITK
jgi:hypothetical protein